MTSITKAIWKCPKCKKEFAKLNQSHKCEIVNVETLFLHREPKLFDIYQKLLKSLKTNGLWIETTSSKAITLYTENRKAFLGIEPKKVHLDIWFLLDKKIKEFPIFKVLQSSKNKFGHFVRLYDKKDIDAYLIKLIGESYDLMSQSRERKLSGQ